MSETTATELTPEVLGFDPNSLREKYLAERDKRLRDDGNQQYIEITGDFSRYIDDPYVEPGFERAPLTDETEVIVIGGGFGGLLAGARLAEAGITNVRIIEKGGDFGGTWYWNRYPGAACDIESYIYLPLLEELNFMPKEKYTHAPEILKYCRQIGEHFNLYDNACFQTEVKGVEWDEATSRWTIHTNRDDAMTARFIVMANGPLHRPKLPGIEGINDYRGHTFHTSRWDYAYTGGSSEGNLDKLADKRVAIIGTGATAVQCVPHVGAAAKSLHVFQRTPSSIDIRNNTPTNDEWVRSLKPGWHQERMDNFNILVSGGFAKEDLVGDGWTEIIRNLGMMLRDKDTEHLTPQEMGKRLEIADFQKMNQIRARCEEIVADPSTAESLKPYYRQFCKRPCFHDEYLAAFNLPGVHLVDTDGKGVERITEKGIVANGVEYEFDCIIFATGFEVGTGYTRRSGYDLVGKGGLSLTNKWSEGVATLHGMHSHSFPNCFIVQNSQSAFTANFPHAMSEQSTHLAYIIRHCLDHDIETVEANEDAENAWVETIISLARFNESYQASCTPGYYNNEGKPNPLSVRNGSYGAGSMAFFKLMNEWREQGDLEGLELTPKAGKNA